MPDFPQSGVPPLTVHTASIFSMGAGTRAVAAGSAAMVSTAWVTANMAIAVPVELPFWYPVQNMFVYNFATIAGNVDVGIYNQDLELIVSAGSTAQAGATALQFFAKDVVLPPGAYYFAMVSSSTTATYAAMVQWTAARCRYMGLVQQLTALPLPDSFAAATVTGGRVPLVGVTTASGTPPF